MAGWDIEHVCKIAGITESYAPSSRQLNEAWDDDDDGDEDPDVARAMKQLKKQGTKLPKAKVDAEKDLTNISGSKKSAAEEAKEEEKEKAEAAAKAAAKKKEAEEAKAAAASDDDDDDDEKETAAHKRHEASETKAEEKAEHGGKAPSKEAEKKETPAEEKKEEAAKKQRGKARSDTSKTGQLRTWIKNHPGVKRAEAWKHAVATLGEKSEDNPGGITKAGFSTLYQLAKKQTKAESESEVKEAWLLLHPSVPGHLLHENAAMGQYQWVHFLNENQDPLIFESEAAAKKVAKYLLEYKNQVVNIERVELVL